MIGRKSRVLGVFSSFLASASLGSDAFSQTDVDIASMSLDELMGVEVTTPGKVPEEIRDTPASVYLVTRSDVEAYGYRTLTEVLENVPGFYNIDNYTGVSGNFGIRGFWNGRSQNSSVAILLNGVPQSRLDVWSNPMESLNIPVEAIDRVEVSRGPNSVIYGNGAAFGAINIITDSSYADDQVSVSVGGYHTRSAAARWSEFGEDFHVILNAGYYETGGVDVDLTELVGPQNQAVLPAFGVTEENLSLDGKLEKAYSQMHLSAAWRDLSFELTHNEAEVESFSGYPALFEGNQRFTRNTRMTLGSEFELGTAYRLSTHLIYNTFDLGENYDALFEGFVGFHGADYNSWELESLLSYAPSDRFRLIGGINLQRLQNYVELTDVPAIGLANETVLIDKRDTRAFFTQLSYSISDALRLVAGGRVEELKEHGRRITADNADDIFGVKGGHENFMPRVSLIYQASDANVLKLMAGDAIKFPSFTDVLVSSEKVRTVEANYSYAADSMLLSGSVFWNSQRDLITDELRFLPNYLVDTDRRTGGEVDTFGVELLARFELTEAYRAEFGATWQDSDYKPHPEGIMSYSPEWVGHAKLSYRKDNFTLSGLYRYVDNMYSFYNVNADEPADRPDGFFGEPVDAYSVVDLHARWDDLWEGVYLSLHVNNVFDTTIRYPNNPINGRLLDRGHLAYERMLSVKAGVEF
ncbi:TonB-dependent receptor [Pelagicoccus sp. SDUM812003]|uniref:TonB-dependent receptor plug domain-containing protein n=1 Tax=Pelagicoccus sp. SDUM812003 TaxID=3041267 RepID=UPI00280CAF57|nr:TonB-dependent receptor [Pelagicoccus sp. SDUM812003]MDQ8201376.1 TonB-dependent receptor [Pelagicoccus sp. SDUM812003]